ncbi:hypothetical protein SprV_1002869800 [Sparganum proliferum]
MASSLEVRRAKNTRGSFMPASSVHWPWGHLASGGVNISTTFNLFLPSCPPATMILPRKCVAASPHRAVLMGAAGCQKSDEVALSRQSARSWQNSTEASQEESSVPPKTKTLLSPGRQAAAVAYLFSRRSGSLNHLCVGEEEEETSEAAKQEDFARKKGGASTSVLSPVPADFIDFTRGKASIVTQSTENADQRLPCGSRQDCGCVQAASNGEGRPFAPAPFCHQKLLDTRGVAPLRSVSSNHKNALFRRVEWNRKKFHQIARKKDKVER